jgi:hypothetical protein
MSARSFESFLARLYTDADFRKKFLNEPDTALNGADLTDEEKSDLRAIDRTGLVMAAHSFFHKRNNRRQRSLLRRWFARRTSVHKFIDRLRNRSEPLSSNLSVK